MSETSPEDRLSGKSNASKDEENIDCKLGSEYISQWGQIENNDETSMVRLAGEGNISEKDPELVYLGDGSGNEVMGYRHRPSVSRKVARRRSKERRKENKTLKGVIGTENVCRSCSCGGWLNGEPDLHCLCSCYLLSGI